MRKPEGWARGTAKVSNGGMTWSENKDRLLW